MVNIGPFFLPRSLGKVPPLKKKIGKIPKLWVGGGLGVKSPKLFNEKTMSCL